MLSTIATVVQYIEHFFIALLSVIAKICSSLYYYNIKILFYINLMNLYFNINSPTAIGSSQIIV